MWADFAQAFRGVVNQLGEAEDAVRTLEIDDRTDEALTDLLACLASLTRWREKHEPTTSTWVAIDEQARFVAEVIDEAEVIYTKRLKAGERACLNCSRAFHSGGLGNRLCERCAGKSSFETSRM